MVDAEAGLVVYQCMFQCFFKALNIPRYNNDVGAFLSEKSCDAPTHALRCTSDKYGLLMGQLTPWGIAARTYTAIDREMILRGEKPHSGGSLGISGVIVTS